MKPFQYGTAFHFLTKELNMTEPTGNQPKRINIELPKDLEANYANFALLSHTPSELFLDFAQIIPNTPNAKVRSRIIMTPMNAKLLHRALTENLQKFEAKYGTIKIPEQQQIMIDPERGFTS
jgi:hypothetical protein